jgi:hypothetical protein
MEGPMDHGACSPVQHSRAGRETVDATTNPSSTPISTRGCVNDNYIMACPLKQHGFCPNQNRPRNLLPDKRPTRQNLLPGHDTTRPTRQSLLPRHTRAHPSKPVTKPRHTRAHPARPVTEPRHTRAHPSKPVTEPRHNRPTR